MTAPDLVIKIGAACVHHQRAFWCQRLFEGEVNLVRPARNCANGAYRRVHHNRVTRRDTQFVKILGQLISGEHLLRIIPLPSCNKAVLSRITIWLSAALGRPQSP